MSTKGIVEGMVVSGFAFSAAWMLALAIVFGSVSATVLFAWFVYCLRKALFDFAAEEMVVRLRGDIECVVFRMVAIDAMQSPETRH